MNIKIIKIIKIQKILLLVFILFIISCNGTKLFVKQTDSAKNQFSKKIIKLKKFFPNFFLEDVNIQLCSEFKKPKVFGEPNPPEGFAGPDPENKYPLGIYVPVNYMEYKPFSNDISVYQWIFHEMFHIHNRRTGEYNKFINLAYPDENDPLVQWIKKDTYHRTFAREEAFINLITFADKPRTANQKIAVRKFYDEIGQKSIPFERIKKVLEVIPH